MRRYDIKSADFRKKTRMMRPSAFARKLFSWFAENLRDLPWRKTKNPYYILVSEIMLQQTQVERVKEYYLRWIESMTSLYNVILQDLAIDV